MSWKPARNIRLIGAMVSILAAIAGASYWDARRESEAAFQDFAGEQTTLARAVAASGLAHPAGEAAQGDAALLAGLRSIERERSLVLLARRAGDARLRTTSGGVVTSPAISDALDRGLPAVRIPRDEAPSFGLPRRTAVAGLARAGAWDVVAVATAERQRDREFWARRRSLLSVFTAAGLVLAFGGLAMRTQRQELVLERELALEAARRARDERLERASRAAVMGTLAMGVAHEISTPLGVIAARAEQVAARAQDGADDRLRTSAQAILSQIDRIKQVIGGLLGLARGDAPTAERIDPTRVIDEAVGLTEHRFGKSRVRLRREVDANLPAVLGDPRLLEHAVVNLLLNACDASRPDDEVTVRARRVDADVEIAVEDAGAGISPADVGRALEPFFTTKPRGQGHGLGLAVAQEIVSSHRGTLALAPRAPRGTRAAIRLPPAEGAARG
ncbi:MAG TPA: ATP-binding protein [Polyangia bacterium]|nr:ATP-binding protein [Polyangia bacterium]